MIVAKLLIDKTYTLQKFPGKGGWTYASIPEIKKNPHAPFGWVRVTGKVDDFEIGPSKLQPFGDGQLFFPVNAKVRKAIGKQAGDTVRILLFEDEISEQTKEDLVACLELEPERIAEKFNGLSEHLQENYLFWIQDAKSEDEKAERILKLIEELPKY